MAAEIWISELKYARISAFSGYRASGHQALTVYREILLTTDSAKSLPILYLTGQKLTKIAQLKQESVEDNTSQFGKFSLVHFLLATSGQG